MAYARMLTGSDGSPTAEAALDVALRLAARLGVEVVLSFAYGPGAVPQERAQEVLEDAVRAARALGLEPEFVIEEDEPAAHIVKTAEERGCDLIVVGSKGLGHPSRFRLGAVAERVAQVAPCDVLIVRTTPPDGSAPAPRPPEYRSILVATDGSPAAEQGVRRAYDLAGRLEASVTLVHAGDPLVGGILLERTARSAPPQISLETERLIGEPAEAIVQMAESGGTHLVVVGHRGLSRVMRLLLGSVSSRIAHHAPVDVLIAQGERAALEDIPSGGGAVVESDGRKLAVYRDQSGTVHALLARCTHMGCTVGWNPVAETWDCPCHGSRFAIDGTVIEGPATRPLGPASPAAPVEAPPAAASLPTHDPGAPRVPSGGRPQAPQPRYVIVGAGLTGGSAAVALREEGFQGEVVLIGAEPHLPYERPPLSKTFLRGETPFADALVQPASWYRDHEVETRLGSAVVRIDPDRREVLIAGGQGVPYDKLLLATGSRNRRPPIPGLDLEGIYDLRTVEDCERLRTEITPGRRAAVVGMGFIGCEVAASLRQRGVDVVAFDLDAGPLQRILGPEMAGRIEAAHHERGVETIFRDGPASFEGSSRVEAVASRQGRRVACDFAVVGLGVRAVTDLVRGTGLRVEQGGIVVDELTRTSVPHVYAAGDVAAYPYRGLGPLIRTEHWQHARRHGTAAARNMLGKGSAYDHIPWFWSDQYDHSLQYTGHHTGWDELIVRGDHGDGGLVVLYVQDAVVTAAAALDRPGEVDAATSLIRAGGRADLARLRDPAVELASSMA
ncbi:MAG: FAD-dependent oxidoreductase [Actinomycetota bacterium]